MPGHAEKYSGMFREDFIRDLRLDSFGEDEIAAVLGDLDALDPVIRQQAFALCHTLSRASSSLITNTVKRIKTVSFFLVPKDFERWMGNAYNILDHRGVGALIDFISKVGEKDLEPFRTPAGLALRDVLPVLGTYLKGISGLELKIVAGQNSYTDTSTVYLPAIIDRYEDRRRNSLIYKFRSAHAWAQLTCGTLTPDEAMIMEILKDGITGHPDIAAIFRVFPEQALAIDIYNILEAVRLEPFLEQQLPGLMREVHAVKHELLMERPRQSGLSQKAGFMEGLYCFFLNEGPGVEVSVAEDVAEAILHLKTGAGVSESMRLLLRLYDIASGLEGDYQPGSFSLLLGTINPEEVSSVLKSGRMARRQRLDGMITRLLDMPEFSPGKMPDPKTGQHENRLDPAREYLLIKGRIIELDSEMREIVEERGGILGGILVKGTDMGGAVSSVTLTDLLEEEEVSEESDGGILYDEWDYRRGGYKNKWCTLYEKNVHPGHEPFVEITRKRYSGYISVLRKKFELLRREPKVLRRQKDGDDIDIDAVIDAFSDMHAGLSPSENLFTKYDRLERNIAVLFLLDMSGSTKGWINEAEKESLVVMIEALESLGDSYAIFGFSGMKRSRCDYYRIKGFDEYYGDTVKDRISGISPKDYTRMGPAIRHSAKILGSIDARIRLFITLSDGRPEDYDSYKGDYAIEDTRMALTEAREQGIHPFCITIDRDAGAYLRHMYGEVNYIVIDDVKKLPARITEIYRRLTT